MVHCRAALCGKPDSVRGFNKDISQWTKESPSNLATVMCIPAAPQILADFKSSNPLYGTILVSVWELGEAVGPLLIAPLSEIYGRWMVYNGTNMIFILFSIACAASKNLKMLVAFRFINGAGDASIALNPSIVGDMFIQEERGLALAIVGLPPLLGPVAGPVLGGFLTQAEGWRWAFWLSAITGGLCEICFLAFFRETYGPRILQARARRLRKETGNSKFHSKYDSNASVTGSYILRHSLIRPGQMLVRSPIVLLFAIYVSVVYGFLYILLTTITEVFEATYGFSQGKAGLAYLGLSTSPLSSSLFYSFSHKPYGFNTYHGANFPQGLGMVTGVLLCAFTSDWYLKKQHAIHGEMKPEYRLPPMVLGGILIPIGLFLYGWTAQYHFFYIVPMIGTATLGFGFFVTTIPLSAYLVDAYKVHAASAIAATIVMRCIVGAVLPLAGPPLYANLGLGWGNSLLGFVGLLFVPVPMLFMYYGERIRKGCRLMIVS